MAGNNKTDDMVFDLMTNVATSTSVSIDDLPPDTQKRVEFAPEVRKKKKKGKI